MNVLVLLGGVSGEREVSLRSGAAVATALERAGHQVYKYDPAKGYSGLGQFVGKVDCVFPILHGQGGEDGEVQAELEKLGLKYLGADSQVSRLCFDKIATKKMLNKLSILTPRWELVNANNVENSELIKTPYVLKPVDGGSTIDTFIVRQPEKSSYDPVIFEKYPEMLLEELILGREITIPVLGDRALPVIEIIPPEGGEFDYENKYNGSTQELCPPLNVSEEEQGKAQHIAERIHRELGVRHLSRTDIIIDSSGDFYVLELNTIPGLTDQSLFPKSAKVAGISMEELVQKFLDMVTA